MSRLSRSCLEAIPYSGFDASAVVGLVWNSEQWRSQDTAHLGDVGVIQDIGRSKIHRKYLLVFCF